MTSMDQKLNCLAKRFSELPDSEEKTLALSLANQWKKRGFLTQAQVDLLKPLFEKYQVAQ